MNSCEIPIKIPTIHSGNGLIRRIKAIIAHKAVSFRSAIFRISHDLGKLKGKHNFYLSGDNKAKGTKSIVEHFFVYIRIQVPNEEICTNFLGSLILRSFIYFNWFPVEFDHVHDFDCIISIVFRPELNESVSLFRLSKNFQSILDAHW